MLPNNRKQNISPRKVNIMFKIVNTRRVQRINQSLIRLSIGTQSKDICTYVLCMHWRCQCHTVCAFFAALIHGWIRIVEGLPFNDDKTVLLVFCSFQIMFEHIIYGTEAYSHDTGTCRCSIHVYSIHIIHIYTHHTKINCISGHLSLRANGSYHFFVESTRFTFGFVPDSCAARRRSYHTDTNE